MLITHSKIISILTDTLKENGMTLLQSHATNTHSNLLNRINLAFTFQSR